MIRPRLMWTLLLLTAATLTAWADDKPDTLALFKQYPQFARITKETALADGHVDTYIRMCRGANKVCEMFMSDGGDLTALTDYAYLFAVYKGRYAEGKATSRNGQGLVEEAQDKGYAQALLSAYEVKYPCAGKKDEAGCVMHRIWETGKIRRSFYEVFDDGAFSIVESDEDGNTQFEL